MDKISSKKIKIYTFTFLALIGIDFIWLSLTTEKIYRHYLGNIITKNPNYIAAVIFFFFFTFGLVYFVILPGIKNKNNNKTVLSGALLGLVAYSTYDLSNLAANQKWSINVTIIDLCWGMILSSLVTFISIIYAKKISK